MPRPPKTNGTETRERILDVAQELFTSQGYDKTSLRDIAERLDITKAALYYYFERKEEILLQLHLRLHADGAELLDGLEAIPDGPERVAAWPGFIHRFVEALTPHRDLLLMHRRNQGAIDALYQDERNRMENEELEKRLERILASDALTLSQRVRMAASIGVITEVLAESGPAFEDVPPDDLAAEVLAVVDGLLYF
ncbi:MAG: TetR/AcrR family transcriptional regulator [Solirubrobacterales bacterium]|nr:TetR/AcrR family transcriptional regulator [Solirubrobacterales bacterium]